MRQNINWGIIGLGNIALRFAHAFEDSKNSTLKGISSNNPEKIKVFQDKFNINKNYCFDNYEDLLECKDIDIVYIALPNSMHKEWILKSINSKKNVLVEKPAFINLLDAEDIKDKSIEYREYEFNNDSDYSIVKQSFQISTNNQLEYFYHIFRNLNNFRYFPKNLQPNQYLVQIIAFSKEDSKLVFTAI